MPNTQTSVPAFTAGQVLTAAQMTEVNTGIPVFATTTTRDAAFGGTGEKTLAEGQFAYIEATNATQYYDGSAWQNVGASGLTLISATTIGSAVSTVTVSNAFSATYDNYKVTISGGVTSVTTTDIRMTLGSTATGYYQAQWYGQYGPSNGAGYDANIAYWHPGRGTSQNISMNMDLFNPFLAKETWATYQNLGVNTGDYVYQGSAFLNNTTSYTAFTIVPAGGTMTGGTIRVYGYQNS